MKGTDLRLLIQGLEALGHRREEVAMAVAMALGGEDPGGLRDLEAPQRNRITLAYAWARVALEEGE